MKILRNQVWILDSNSKLNLQHSNNPHLLPHLSIQEEWTILIIKVILLPHLISMQVHQHQLRNNLVLSQPSVLLELHHNSNHKSTQVDSAEWLEQIIPMIHSVHSILVVRVVLHLLKTISQYSQMRTLKISLAAFLNQNLKQVHNNNRIMPTSISFDQNNLL